TSQVMCLCARTGGILNSADVALAHLSNGDANEAAVVLRTLCVYTLMTCGRCPSPSRRRLRRRLATDVSGNGDRPRIFYASRARRRTLTCDGCRNSDRRTDGIPASRAQAFESVATASRTRRSISIGRGKIMVEFFSDAISVSV